MFFHDKRFWILHQKFNGIYLFESVTQQILYSKTTGYLICVLSGVGQLKVQKLRCVYIDVKIVCF